MWNLEWWLLVLHSQTFPLDLFHHHLLPVQQEEAGRSWKAVKSMQILGRRVEGRFAAFEAKNGDTAGDFGPTDNNSSFYLKPLS